MNPLPHITHIITGLSLGGAEQALLRLVRAGQGKLFNNHVISLQAGGSLVAAFEEAGVPVYELGLNPRLPNPFKLLHLISAIRASKPDLVQTWMYHADLLGGLAAKLARRVPIVWNIRNLSFDQQYPNRLTQAVVRLSAIASGIVPDKIISNSVAARDEHIRLGYAKDRMLVIPNGFDLAVYAPNNASRRELREELGVSHDSLLVGLMARFDPLKDHASFVQAAALLAVEFKHIHFVLAGTHITWENNTLRQVIEDAGLRHAFSLLGPRADVSRIMSALDLLVSASVSESFPNVVGEAMASGVPCVVTDVGDSRILVGDTGLVVPPRDPKQLADACAKVLKQSQTQRLELGQAARQRIQSNFSLELSLENYSRLYTELIRQKQL